MLDVRPAEEYRAGHIPGAFHSAEGTRAPSFGSAAGPRDCRLLPRPYCVLAVEAVEMLRARGFSAFRLEESVQDWRARACRLVGEER